MEILAAAGGVASIVARVAFGIRPIAPWTCARGLPELAAGAPAFAEPAEG